MAERIKTVVIVTILAVVVWLFAEAESLGEDEVGARIEFAPSPALLIRSEPRSPTVRVALRGGKAALQRAASVLETPVRLEPGRGIPDSDTNGFQTIDLADALRRHPALGDTRVTIEFVRPPTIEVSVESLEVVSLPIQPDLPDVQTEGPIAITPPRAEVRLPRSLIGEVEDSVFAIARPTSEQSADLVPGAHAMSVPVQLPPMLQGQPGVTLLTDRTRLEFGVVSTLVTETLPSVPVQILLAPTEANEWVIDIDDQDQILSIELTGPRAIMSDLKSVSVGVSIVAVLALSDIDLQSGVTSKPVGFALLRDGALQSLPREVTVRAERSEVRFTARRMSQP